MKTLFLCRMQCFERRSKKLGFLPVPPLIFSENQNKKICLKWLFIIYTALSVTAWTGGQTFAAFITCKLPCEKFSNSFILLFYGVGNWKRAKSFFWRFLEKFEQRIAFCSARDPFKVPPPYIHPWLRSKTDVFVPRETAHVGWTVEEPKIDKLPYLTSCHWLFPPLC